MRDGLFTLRTVTMTQQSFLHFRSEKLQRGNRAARAL
jgi:hypothetical protein